MEFGKREFSFVISVGVVVLLIVLLSLFQMNLTGKVVWEPTVEVVNCSEAQVGALWDEIFVESSSGVTIINESLTDCEGVVAYKVVGERVFLLDMLNVDYPEGYLTINNLSVNHSYVTIGRYFEANATFIASFEQEVDYGGSHLLLLDFENISNQSLSSVSEAESAYSQVFGGPAGSFIANSSEYGVTLFHLGPFEMYGDFEGEENTNFIKIFSERIFKNDKYMESSYAIYEGTRVLIPTLKQNISNYTFEINSSWNYAFDVKDIFDYGAGTSVSFNYTGENNTGGLNINWTINETKVYFQPAANYIGTKEFKLKASSSTNTTYSNIFKVTIVEDLNDPPILKELFEQLFVPRLGNLTIRLRDYFSDPDGDDLTYSTSNLTNITVSFESDKMIIKLNENFTNQETFYVYASDGEASVPSNKIYVFEESPVITYSSNGTNESLFLGAVDGGNVSFGGNISGNNSTGGISFSEIPWFIWVLGGFVLLGVAGIIIYFTILSAPPKSEEGISSPQVQNYLDELKGKEASNPPEASSSLPAESQKVE